jgi:hypothetical protein
MHDIETKIGIGIGRTGTETGIVNGKGTGIETIDENGTKGGGIRM